MLVRIFKQVLRNKAGEGDGGGSGGGAGGALTGGGGSAGGGDGKGGEGAGSGAGGSGSSKGAAGGEGGAGASWKDSLPDDLKNDPSLKAINDVSALAKSYIHAQKAVGANKLVIPGQHATDEEWREVYSKLGLPKDLKEFNVELPKEASFDGEFVDKFKEIAHKAGILPKQAQALVNWFNESSKAKATELAHVSQVETQKALNDLKTEWGAAYDSKISLAQQAIAKWGDKPLVEWLNKTGLTNNANLIKFVAKAAESLKEDKITGDGGEAPLTPAEATKQLNTIYGDMKHPYWTKDHPGHKAAVQEVQKLNSFLKPS